MAAFGITYDDVRLGSAVLVFLAAIRVILGGLTQPGSGSAGFVFAFGGAVSGPVGHAMVLLAFLAAVFLYTLPEFVEFLFVGEN